ncbi:MAG: integrase arm-type DNA-binding domain-containing protein [Methylotenera sp.]|uniref:tyrosine-type recombinase/integrase n=1 Tax=Methylotenera sp. TaxID=2051956 RepID=UPI002719DA88|nr:integrase arm-type DNA-binding domain-containing protein [Methylotenera sp.]MDO9392966.1 integrase arm-type DNA-binding domain-containing protein [Methylotenera sp.]
MPLNELKVKNAKPRDKDYKLTDERGMYLLVTKGGGKLWRFNYRFENKRKTLALGAYPDVSLSEARIKREDGRKLLANTVDPGAHKKAVKSSRSDALNNSFEVVAREWVDYHFKKFKLTDGHKDKTLRRLEIHVFPFMGSDLISEINPPQVFAVLNRIEKLNVLETAHRVKFCCGQVFRYAVLKGYAERDVTADLRGALPPTNVKHMAAVIDPTSVAALLRAIDGFKGGFTVQCALKLAPLFFARPGELRRAKWKEIDFEKKEWRYIASKSKSKELHIVPLSMQAIEVLKELQQFSGHGEWLFMGGRDPKKAMSEAAINAALQRMGYDTKTDITGHGFRAMARTMIEERLKFNKDWIELQLSHSVPDPLGGAYGRAQFLDDRRIMMQSWADYLDELKAGAQVIQLKAG